MGNTVKRVPVFDILRTLFRVCFSILYSSIGTKLTWKRPPREQSDQCLQWAIHRKYFLYHLPPHYPKHFMALLENKTFPHLHQKSWCSHYPPVKGDFFQPAQLKYTGFLVFFFFFFFFFFCCFFFYYVATVSKNFKINLEGQNYVHFYVILSPEM